ncbi:MAG: hypothetical protein CMJ83_08660 [Planctomycetes bacterium]|nr:hypothetical protein [Planctomycetota bacterium]
MRRPKLELCAIAVTAVLFQIFESGLGLKGPFLLGAVVVWGGYLATRLRAESGLWNEWGLGRRGLGPATRICGGLLLVGIAALTTWRLAFGWQGLPVTALVIFALYPVWSFVQQFVLQILVVRNLDLLGAPRAAVVMLGALGFGAAHYPDLPLSGICAGIGLLWVPIYLRTRNLWPLSLCHAWLGALTYYWVLERDPWTAIFPG